MEEGLFQFLTLIPGLTRVHARRLSNRFPSFEALAAAPLEEILRVEGFTPDLARRVKRAVESRHREPGTVGLYICPSCGSFVAERSDRCPNCGVAFEGEAEAPAPAPAEARPAPKPEVAPSEEPIPEEVREALRGIGIDAEKVKALEAKSRWEPTATGLFLCSNCGGFISATWRDCPTCGAIVEGDVEAAPAAEEARALEVKEGLPSVCLHCGAFNDSKANYCGTCGRPLETRLGAARPVEPPAEVKIPEGFLAPRRERKPAPAPELPPPEVAPAPPPAPAAPAVPPEAPKARPERRATRDFARRWQRIAEERAVEPKAKLEEELDHWNRLLEADPELERAWHRKAQILVELGRRPEALEAFDSLALLNPAREEEYRLEALNVARVPADVSPIPPAWEGPSADRTPLLRALEFYDRLLAADPTLQVAWETKAELLRQLGRSEEASGAEAKAREAEERLARVSALGLFGLETRVEAKGPRRRVAGVGGRVNGMTNGLVNGSGRVNGLVNGLGRVNGLVNGLGRVNGLVNGLGRVNGLVNGLRGQVNGLGRVNGISFGRGMTNGLVNGDGFVNGRRGQFAEEAGLRAAWVRPTASVAMVLTLMVLMPLLVSYLGQQLAPPSITVDGRFADWAATRQFSDQAGDTAVGSTDLLAWRVHALGEFLSGYVETAAPLFQGSHPDGMNFVSLFADTDLNPETGFFLRGIGADHLLQVIGSEGRILQDALLEWTGETHADDYAGFVRTGSVAAAVTGGRLEFQAYVASLADFRAVLAVSNNWNATDLSDAAVSPRSPALVATEVWVGADVLAGDGLVQTLDFTAPGEGASVTRLTWRQTGNVSENAVTFTVYRDDGDGAFSPTDVLLASGSPQAGFLTLTAPGRAAPTLRYFVTATFTGAPPTATVGLRLASAGSEAAVSLRNSTVSKSYYLAAPALTTDGAFGDWDPARLQADADDDVTRRGGDGVNQNVDLRAFAMTVPDDIHLYFRVDGRVLGGVDIPFLEMPSNPVPPDDTDHDSVPDDVERGLSATLEADFDNDNVTDAEERYDVDSDGLLDYPVGTDFWLNTTIPDWYPPPYAGRPVVRYVGPIAPRRIEGTDSALAYIDADNRTDTGLVGVYNGVALGVDYAVEIRGRAQRIVDAGVYAFVPGRDRPWEWIGDVAAALDATRLEASVPAGLVNLSADRRVAFYLRDPDRNYDSSYSFQTRSGQLPQPLNPAGTDVVINEIQPSAATEWFEIANPTSTARNLNGCVIEIKQGNKYVTVYTFTQTVGAWGSGSEYLAVNLNNKLPNANGMLRLRCGATVIDEATYPNVPSTQSWSRFKDPVTGKPTDTDGGGDFYMDTTPTKGAANTRHRPTIVVAKTSSVAQSGPGGTITYTIYYNNTDTGQANNVWVNDTLAGEVTFVSSSVPYSSVSGSTYGWYFTNVGPNTQNSFTITVSVGLANDGASLVNSVQLAYTDQMNKLRPGSQAWANVTVARPVISVVKVADSAEVPPGGSVTYTIYYENTGSANANTVWVNDTLPAEVTFVSSSVPPSSSSGQTYRWVFTNVAPGNTSFTITAQVNANATTGNITNWVTLDYTSQYDYLLESSSDTAVVYVPEYDAVLVAFGVLPIAIGLRWRSRSKKEKGADGVPTDGGR